jgi:hypothetical protein
MRADLVLAHQPTEAGNIGVQDGGKASLRATIPGLRPTLTLRHDISSTDAYLTHR